VISKRRRFASSFLYGHRPENEEDMLRVI